MAYRQKQAIPCQHRYPPLGNAKVLEHWDREESRLQPIFLTRVAETSDQARVPRE